MSKCCGTCANRFDHTTPGSYAYASLIFHYCHKAIAMAETWPGIRVTMIDLDAGQDCPLYEVKDGEKE